MSLLKNYMVLHGKYVNSAVRHGTKMPAPFFYSQADKKALKDAKDAKLKAARTAHLLVTKDEREKKQAKDKNAYKQDKV